MFRRHRSRAKGEMNVAGMITLTRRSDEETIAHLRAMMDEAETAATQLHSEITRLAEKRDKAYKLVAVARDAVTVMEEIARAKAQDQADPAR